MSSRGEPPRGRLVTYGPAVVSPAAFRSGLAVSQASWFVLPQAPAMARQGIGALAGSTSQAVTKLTTALPSGLQVTTRLPRLLAGIAGTIVLARSLFTIGALELLLVSAAALVLAARLLASLRDEESALLQARGATRWQMTRPVLAEALILGAVGGTVGVLAGVRLAGPLARARNLRLDGYQATGIRPLAWLSALVVLALCAAVMTWPALHAVTPDAARIRQGRQARLAGIAWAGGDLAVVALAALAVWQLRGYSAVAHPAAGSLGIDPAVAVAPALALAAVALVPLRTLPLLARLADRATERGRRLAAAMVSWQIGRRPIRQAGPVLLVVVATATTTLALAGYASWQRSAADQAAFAVGSDVRVDFPAAVPVNTGAITGAPGVAAATPASVASLGHGGQLIALDARHRGPDDPAPPRPVAASAELAVAAASSRGGRPGWRCPASRTGWRSSRPSGRPRTAARRRYGRSLAQSPSRPRSRMPTASAYQIPAGVLPADGQRHALVVPLPGPRQASYPLRLLGLSLTYVLPPYDPASPLAAPTAEPQHRVPRASPKRPAARSAGRSATVPPWRRGRARDPRRACRPGRRALRDVAAIGRRTASDPGLAWRPRRCPAPHVQGRTRAVGIGHEQRRSRSPGAPPGRSAITARPPSQVVPAIATSGYLAASRLHTGSTVSVPLGGFPVPVQIVASVARFPTVFGRNQALIADLGTVSDLLVANQVMPLPVTRWWLRTRGGRVPRLQAGPSVAGRARQRAALLHNPLLTAPRQAMLAIGAAAVLLGVLGFSVSVAASLRTRRTQSAVLAALGVGRRAQARQLCLEQFALSVPAAAAGLLAGIGLARLMVPAITLTAGASGPVPPALTVVPLGPAAALALVTAVLPVAAAALSVARRPDPAAQLRAEAR